MAGCSEDDSSPKNCLKFLCSYGGKILPRPSDGQLKYVGGETRVFVVSRSITFSELMEKVRAMCHAEALIKYQLMPEDLDALVSVTCDEDLHHMLDEYDRQDSLTNSPTSSPRLRVFLFPTQPQATHIASSSSTVEQRYFDAINGIPVPPSSSTAAAAGRSIFSLSSPTTMSPNSSLNASAAAALSPELRIGGRQAGFSGGMHRVRSTPNMSSYESQMTGHSGSAVSPRAHQHHHQQSVAQPLTPLLQKQHSANYGSHLGPLSGIYKVNCAAHGAGACWCHGVSFQPQPLRPYYYMHSPAGGGWCNTSSRGCTYCGHADEGCAPPPPRAGHGYTSALPP